MISAWIEKWQIPAERARILLILIYGIRGITFFSILARFPTIQSSLKLTIAGFGLILAFGSIGWALATFLSSWAIKTWGSNRIHIVGVAVAAIGCVAMGFVGAPSSIWMFTVANLINCIGLALVNAVSNIESTRIERNCNRSVIPHFHASMSAGAVIGSLLGAAISAMGIPIIWHFAFIGFITWLLLAPANRLGMVLPPSPFEKNSKSTGPEKLNISNGEVAVWKDPKTFLLGIIAFTAMIADANACNWVSIAFVKDFAMKESTAGLILGLFISSMTLVRMFGTKLIDFHGRKNVLLFSCVLGLIGIGMFGFSRTPMVAGMGVLFWGAATALCFPIALAEAGQESENATSRVSAISFISSMASPISPLILGLLLSFMGIRFSLLILVGGMFCASIFVLPLLDKNSNSADLSEELFPFEPRLDPLAAPFSFPLQF